MTPGARVAAAIEIFDAIAAGSPVEHAFKSWSRGNRYAGSGDRFEIRNLLFEALRRKRSLAFRGAGETGRCVFTGLFADADVSKVFSGEGYAPPPLSNEEISAIRPIDGASDPVRLDYPDFLDAELRRSLGANFEDVLAAQQKQAPVDIRANTLKTDRDGVLAILDREGIEAHRLNAVPTAIRVTGNARKLSRLPAFEQGYFEFQDASSQAVSSLTNVQPGMTVLDFCAGAGGKTLAMAAIMGGAGRLVAYDANSKRMADLQKRADRAGAQVEVVTSLENLPEFDLVLVDAPCSGSGTWRRDPMAKWSLTPARLADLCSLQIEILSKAICNARSSGVVCYVTCSLLQVENLDIVNRFIKANNNWKIEFNKQLTPMCCGDAFFCARLSSTA